MVAIKIRYQFALAPTNSNGIARPTRSHQTWPNYYWPHAPKMHCLRPDVVLLLSLHSLLFNQHMFKAYVTRLSPSSQLRTLINQVHLRERERELRRPTVIMAMKTGWVPWSSKHQASSFFVTFYNTIANIPNMNTKVTLLRNLIKHSTSPFRVKIILNV